MKKKVLVLATTAAMIEQFNKNNIIILENLGYEVHVIGNWLEGNPISDEKLEEFKEWLSMHNGKWFHMSSTRKPLDINNYRAYKQVVELIKKEDYSFIHCHTPIGSVIGRLAAHKTHTKVIYTAHGFHFYKGASIIKWMLYYPVEKYLSRWTDILITINKEDYQRASECFSAVQTLYIPGIGIDITNINSFSTDSKEIRKLIGVNEDEFMILSVGEIIPRKNHKTVIKALAYINDCQIKYCICGKGDTSNLERLASRLGVRQRILFLGYRSDILRIYKAADLFVFPSLQEGLSVSLMEAIASKCEVCASKIRGNTDLLSNDINLFSANNFKELAGKIIDIKNGVKGNVEDNYLFLKQFDINIVNEKMKDVYRIIV